MARQTYAEQLERARLMLSIAGSDTELADRLGQMGYGPAALAEGQALYDAALQARTRTHAAHGDQLGSTDSVETIRARVEDQVSALSQMARTVFQDNNDALETLGLRLGLRATPETADPNDPPAPSEAGTPLPPGEALPGKRRRSQSQAALLDRARLLYDGALNDPDLLPPLQQVGYTRTRLQTERADVTTLEALDTTQEGRKAEAQARTAAQTAALDALNDWISRLRGVAKAGLRERPDLLDKLGM